MAKGRSRRAAAEDATPPSVEQRIVDAAMELVAELGWRRLSMAAIANRAHVSILDVYHCFPSKTAILHAFSRRIDETVLATPLDAEPDARPRDQVFDLLMRRFDALQPYRRALQTLRRELPGDPLAALCTGAGLLHSIAWTLEAAAISTVGIGGIAAVKLTTAAYLMTMRVWLGDDSPDLGPTMAALDRRLRGIERWYGSPGRGVSATTAARS